MIERLEATLEKYNYLEQELTKPEVLSDVKKTREYSKEMASLEDIVNCYKKYKRVLEDIEKMNGEVFISGSGFGGQGRYTGYGKDGEDRNKTFIIQIIPYIKYN